MQDTAVWKCRIKTPSEKPEENGEANVQSSALITEAISQAHQVQRRPSLEHAPITEDKKEEDITPDIPVNTQEAKGEGEETKDIREGKDAGEEKPNPNASMDLTELPNQGEGPSCAAAGAAPKKGPQFKQRKKSRDFKSKPPKKGVLGFGDDIPGMDGLGTDITVICPWEAFSHLELHELAQFGII
ncbi:uncharacterized protein PAF06_013991 [Gastrophryne carolinensis]